MSSNETLTLQQHLKNDKRLVDFDQKIGFVKLFQNELLDKKTFLRLEEMDKKQLTLTKDLHFIIKMKKVFIETDNATHQPIGKTIIYEFVNILNEQQNATLIVSIYDVGEHFIYSRNDFLNTIAATTMMFIPFSKGPADLGTVSIDLIKEKEYNKIAWIDHNIFFILDTRQIDDKYLLDIAYWVQQRIIKDN